MPASAEAARVQKTHRISTFLAHATFIPTGAITVMLGPLLPTLSAHWGLSDARAGYLISAQFAGALISTVGTSAVVPRWGFCMTVAAGQLLMAVGVSALMAGNFATAVVAVVGYGAGIGLTIPTVNLMIAESKAEHRSSALNLLNFSWSAGAVACPIVLALTRQTAVPVFLRGMAAVLVILAVLVLFVGSRGSLFTENTSSLDSKPRFQHFANPAFIALGTIFFLYVGSENAISAWLASYAKRASAMASSNWATVPSYFYAALLLGRAVAPLSLRRWTDQQQARFGLLLAIASITGLLFSSSVLQIAACALFCGLGFSTLYPIAIASLSDVFGSAASRIGGWMFALSTLGGASLPWLVGFASTQFGSLRIALVIPLVGCAVMLWPYSSSQLRSQI